MRSSTMMLAATSVIVSSAMAFEFPASVPEHKRQVSAEEYACHEACGTVILDYETGTTDYCSTEEYATYLADCLECAETYDIWQYYGDSVELGAEACGDDATPSASSASAAAAATTTAAAVAETSAVAAATTAAAVSAATSAAAVASSAASNMTYTATSVYSGSSSATASSSIVAFTGGASQLLSGGVIGAAGAVAFAVGFF